MTKSKKYTSALNKQLTALAIGIICILFALPAILSGNFHDLIDIHPGRLRSLPLLAFLLLGLVLIIFSTVNIIRITGEKNKKGN